MTMRVAIVGAGSWGTALATLAARCGHEVTLWAHDPSVASTITGERENTVYLPGVALASAIRATSDLSDVSGAELVVMATPSHHYRNVLGELAAVVPGALRVVSATKGIENESLLRVSQITEELLGGRLANFGTISGPSFALEVARRHPTAAVVASRDPVWAESVQYAMSCDSFRLYRSDDVVGTEIGGAMKNVVAIAAGVVEGLGLGSNTMAALVTRGLSEIRRLGASQGGRPETFAGLAGMGDLILTCTGGLSRNRSLGVRLGRGESLESVLGSTRSVAEGVRTCRSARDLAARHGIEMPITEHMYRVLYEGLAPADAIQRLMSRALKIEE